MVISFLDLGGGGGGGVTEKKSAKKNTQTEVQKYIIVFDETNNI